MSHAMNNVAHCATNKAALDTEEKSSNFGHAQNLKGYRKHSIDAKWLSGLIYYYHLID